MHRPITTTGNFTGNQLHLVRIKQLCFVYFWLLIAEGAVRKWVLPGLSNPLLIVRDPVAIVILVLSTQTKLLERAALLKALLYMVVGFSGIGMLQVVNGLNPAIMIYGLRTYFLHLPLIWVIGRVLDYDDFRRLCRQICYVAIGMTPLIVLQFLSSPGALINTVAGGIGEQIGTNADKIRPVGLFSYNLAVTYFYACAAAIGLTEEATSALLPRTLTRITLVASLMVIVVSGSRTTFSTFVLIFVGLILAMLLNRNNLKGGVRSLAVVGLGVILLGSTGVFIEGVDALRMRFADAGEQDGGVVNRFAGSILYAGEIIQKSSFFGSGLGLGTNVGANLASGFSDFLMGEDEWGRIINEAGLVLGLSYVLWRLALAASLLRDSLSAARRANMLPLLLWFGSVFNWTRGAWGQPSNLGFAVFSAGLAIAALRVMPDAVPSHQQSAVRNPGRPIKTRHANSGLPLRQPR